MSLPNPTTTSANPFEQALFRPEHGLVTAERYVAKLQEMGKKVKRASGGWMAQCPIHDDHVPSLHVSIGPRGRLLLHCHGCPASFRELLAAANISSQAPIDTQYRDNYVLQRRYSCSNHDLGVTSAILWVSEDPERLCSDTAFLELPTRGRLMRAVAEDMMMKVNLRRCLDKNERPIAYGCDEAAKEFSTDRRNIRRVLRALEARGTIECVGQLPQRDLKLSGAKLYALRVAVLCPLCAGDVEAAPEIPGPDASVRASEMRQAAL